MAIKNLNGPQIETVFSQPPRLVHLRGCNRATLTTFKMSAKSEDCDDFANVTKSTAQLNGSYKTSRKEKVKCGLRRTLSILSKTTVEPCLSLYMVSSAISSLAMQNMNLEKACRVNLEYGDEICDRIMSANASDFKKELANVQALVAGVVAWKFPLQTAIPALLLPFIGAWSDRTRKRKVCMLAPMVGEIVTCAGLLLATHFMNDWSLHTTALIEALPPALTGGWITMFMGMYSYMTDITTTEERTFRLGVVTLFVTLGTPTGNALSGILLSLLGYYGVFSLLLCLHMIAFSYGLARIRDVKVQDELSNGESESWCRNFFAVKLVVDSLRVLFKKRHGNQRVQIIAVLILYLLMVGPLYGDSQVAYLYAQYKFNFTAVQFSFYSTLNVVLGLVGTFICIFVLIKLLHVDDSTIGVLAGASRIASCFLVAFAPTRGWYYAAPAINIFSHTGLTAVRSMSSKLVPAEEVAKLSSLLGVAEALAPSIYMPASSAIYVASQQTLPGAFYLFDAGLTLLAVLIFAVCFWLRRGETNAFTKTVIGCTEPSAAANEITKL